MKNIITIFRREVAGYFSTVVAYVFIAIFLLMTGLFTFSLGGFFERREASLFVFFDFHPWLYLFLIPAISMRVWAEERNSGTIELLLTLPVTLTQAVIGKFLAAWFFVGVALALTFPIVITVTYLGDPDMGVIIASYLGSFLMAGAYLSIGCAISALSKSQVLSFIISVVICFFFLLAGLPVLLDWFTNWAPQILIDSIKAISFLTHFNSIERGILVIPDILFFVSLIFGWLFLCRAILEVKKAS